MKKLFIASLFLLLFISCGSLKKTVELEAVPKPAITLLNDVDSMSYALGLSMGFDLSRNLETIPGGQVNKEMILLGLEQSLIGDSTLLTDEEAQKYFQKYMINTENMEKERLKLAGENFLAENSNKESVQTTDSGLQYEVLLETEGDKPTAESTVKVHYSGTTIEGRVFDSSVERGEPVEFVLNQVIAGWTEGVQLMSVGSKYKFYIPYNLAYGERGVPQAGISAFAPLIFEVELLEIVK